MERNSNVFKFQGSSMIVCAKGPNIDRNMNMSTSFRSNLMSSTMNMPRNFEKQSSAMSVVSQRSIHYGRETSPTASVRSDMQPRNFQQSFYQRGFSQRSVYNGRGGSPVSMRSIDSSASLATDIVQAINNGNFNRQEWKMIQEAFSRSNRRKYDYRKKAEKRRKMKIYLKNLRNRSGDDSGEQGSNSSISSDDCASTRTGYSRRYDRNYKENIPRSTTSTDYRSEDIFQRNNRDMYRGYSEIDSQNPYQKDNGFQGDMEHPVNILPYQKNSQFGNMYLSQTNGLNYNRSTLYSQNKTVGGSTNTFYNQKYMNTQTNMFPTHKNTLNSSVCSTKSMQNMTMMSQRDRFKGGFQFPSQKFNRSSTLYEEQEVLGRQFPNNQHTTSNHLHTEHIDEHSDENDDILDTTGTTKPVPKKSASRPKRKAESLGDVPVSAKKKPKTVSNVDKPKKQAQNKNNKMKEFEFVKPQFPIRKSAPAKPKEKLISKSVGAPDIVFGAPEKELPCPEPAAPPQREPEIEPVPEQLENTHLTNSSDTSMRPSFLKRKLFTQTLDVTERKNNSSDSLATDSPQSNIYSSLSREKHKTRKLVTSQSLFSRDVNEDDNNLLDLIHKIVPPNQVNSTITNNITKSFNSRFSGNKPDDDKFDITSIISTCNNDSVSETYTDDEIFKVINDDKKKKSQEKPLTKQINSEVKSKAINEKPENKKTVSCPKNVKIVLNKVALQMPPKVQTPVKTCPAKAVVTSNHIDGFWDTDVESDFERATPRPQETLLRDATPNPIVNPKSNNPEIRPTNLSTKFTKNIRTHELSPTVVKKNEPTLIKVLKKQTSKKTPNKSETKTVKKSNDNTKTVKKSNDDKKTSKKLNDDKQNNKLNDTQSLKSERHKRGTPTIVLKTRRQINLSASFEAVDKTSLKKKGTSPKKTESSNDKTSQITKKQSNEKKTIEEKSDRTKPPQKDRNGRQNDSQTQTKAKVEETPKTQRHAKITKLQNDVEQIETSVCKTLRSRIVDLSSSFNSDKFELTMSRTRKSRTPSKRISFNKSKNLLINNKTRNRATKA